MSIHPSAVVDSRAEVDPSADIGPMAVLEGPVRIGPHSKVGPHAQIYGPVVLGEHNDIGGGAVIGALAQDLNASWENTGGLCIGDHNVFREYVTVHRSAKPEGFTELGDKNFLMTGAHVGHDVRMGDENIFANNVLLAGHVTIGSHCFLGGASVFHQFIRIGDGCMVQGMSGTSHDIPPYVIAAGINAVAGLNSVGLRRRNVAKEARRELRKLFGLFYRDNLNRNQALETADKTAWESVEARKFIEAIRSPTSKGVCLRLREST